MKSILLLLSIGLTFVNSVVQHRVTQGPSPHLEFDGLNTVGIWTALLGPSDPLVVDLSGRADDHYFQFHKSFKGLSRTWHLYKLTSIEPNEITFTGQSMKNNKPMKMDPATLTDKMNRGIVRYGVDMDAAIFVSFNDGTVTADPHNGGQGLDANALPRLKWPANRLTALWKKAGAAPHDLYK